MGEIWPKLRPWVFLLIVLIITAFVLSRSAAMPRLADDAQQDVLNDYRMAQEERLLATNPDMPEGELRIQSAQAMREYTGTAEFKRATAQRAAEYRAAFSDSDGKPFLLHNDPYNYLREAENIEKYGFIGTELFINYIPKSAPPWRNVKHRFNQTEKLELYTRAPQRLIREKIDAIPKYTITDRIKEAPTGTIVANSDSLYGVVLPHLFTWLQSSIGEELRDAAYWYPVLIGILTVGLLFALIYRLSNAYGALLGSLLFAIHPAFFAAAEAGYADTNALILFHMVAIGLLVSTIISTERPWIAIASSALLGLAMWSFAFTWTGHIAFVVLLLAYVGALGFALLVSKAWQKNYGRWVVGTSALVIGGGAALILKTDAIRRGMEYLTLANPIGEILPNPYALIAELSQFTWGTLFRVLGGFPMLVIIAAAVVYLIMRIFKKQKSAPADLLLLCWLAVFALPGLRIRFFIFFLIPLVIVIGLALGEYLEALPRAIAVKRTHGLLSKVSATRGILCIAIIGLMLILFIPGLSAEINAALPTLDDAMEKTATALQDRTPETAIINAWWDSGYFYEALAERPTLANGASPGTMKTYWLAQAYLQTYPWRTRGMLRMLDCGGAGTMLGIPKTSPEDGKALLMDIFIEDNATAGKIIMERKGTLTTQQIITTSSRSVLGWVDGTVWVPQLLQQTHCTPREAYLPLSEDLLRKLWVFEIYQNAPLDGTMPQTTHRYALPPVSCDRTGSTLRCGSYVINLRTNTAMANAQPIPLLTKPNGELLNQTKPEGNALMLYRDTGTGEIQAMELKQELFDTLLGQLYFFGPVPGFAQFSDFAGPYSGRVVTYRIDWSAMQTGDVPA